MVYDTTYRLRATMRSVRMRKRHRHARFDRRKDVARAAVAAFERGRARRRAAAAAPDWVLSPVRGHVCQ